eukprot:768003-Hanusia_phi.AAC.7
MLPSRRRFWQSKCMQCCTKRWRRSESRNLAEERLDGRGFSENAMMEEEEEEEEGKQSYHLLVT